MRDAVADPVPAVPSPGTRSPVRTRLRRAFPPLPRSRGWPPYLWLVYLAPVLLPVAMGITGLRLGIATVVLVLAFVASYLQSFHATGDRLVGYAAWQAAIGAVLGPWHPFASVFGVYAACTMARHERPRRAWGGMLVVVAGLAAWYWLLDAPTTQLLGIAVVAPVIGAVTLHDERARRADLALADAHARMAALATTAERERIARDLHDVLGHTLSLVVLKAQVAKRLVAREPLAALRELQELEEAARGALGDVRQAIRGYRATLDEEVRAARALLLAAGVEVDARIALDVPDAARDAVLAPVLRELVTNVARHAGASRCRIALRAVPGAVELTVSDDGRGGARADGQGLLGVASRVASVGGRLEIGAADDGPARPARPGTTIVVTLPAARRDVRVAESAA